MILARNVSKTFISGDTQVRALVDASVRIGPGELVCLYGRSGSGKSTLLNVLAGLVEPDEGTVTVMGEEVTALSVSGRAQLRLTTIGVVFQDNNLIPELQVLANVALPLRARGMSSSEAGAQAQEALDLLEVGELSRRFPNQLSGGQQQRVGVARGLVGQRPVLLADEPTGALDSQTAHALFEAFRAASERGVTVVVATHDPIAREYATRCLEMVDGILIGRGSEKMDLVTNEVVTLP